MHAAWGPGRVCAAREQAALLQSLRAASCRASNAGGNAGERVGGPGQASASSASSPCHARDFNRDEMAAIWRLSRRHKMVYHDWLRGRVAGLEALELSEQVLCQDASLARAALGGWC